MAAYIGRRLLTMVPLLFAVSILSFTIIQLPPGDYLSARIAQLKLQGTPASEEQIDSLRKRYGLDEPFHVQYVTWVGGMLQGDLGMSFIHKRPVSELIGERLILTVFNDWPLKGPRTAQWCLQFILERGGTISAIWGTRRPPLVLPSPGETTRR